MAFDENSYRTKYKHEHYDNIFVRIPKGKKAILQEISNQTKMPVSQCVIEALEYYYNIDLHTRNKD